MRAAAMSVWIFINLLFFGMCGYLYLIWSQYWMYIEKQRFFNRPTGSTTRENSLNVQDAYGSDRYIDNSYMNKSRNQRGMKSRRSAIGGYWSSGSVQHYVGTPVHQPTNNIIHRVNGGPRFPNVHNPLLEFDSDKYVCEDFASADCEARTEEFKQSLLKEFHRVLMGEGSVFKSGLNIHNTYNVQHTGGVGREQPGRAVLCAMGRVPVQTVTSQDEPFKSQGYRIPADALQRDRSYNTCAVVTSAGALLHSGLGGFIDSHDMVLRFNNAPTENYTDDVGSKTTFRILNSQVVSKPEYSFLENPLFRNISILIWDPANYSSTLVEWFHHPDFSLFPVYKRLLNEREDADVHLLRPEVLWKLWAVLQDSSPYRLRRNPPSSGFLGLWFSLHRCNRVRMFEYVPSAHATRRCHYHAARADPGCTLGAWHPLAQEKALAERMRDNTDFEVFQRGFIDVPGFRTAACTL